LRARGAKRRRSRDVRAKPAYRNRSAAQSLRVRSSKTAARRRGPSGIASGLGRCRAVLPSIRPRRPRAQDYRGTRTASTCRASELECVKGIGFTPVGGFQRHASLDVSRAGSMSVALIAGIHPTIPRASGIRSYVIGLARGLSRVGEDVVLVGVDPWLGIHERRAHLVRGLYHAAERITLSRVDHVICVSQTGLEVYLERFPHFRSKFSAIPVGIDLSLFRPLNRTAARRELGLDD